MTYINEQLAKLVAEQFSCEPNSVTADTNLVADLDMDSLDMLETVMAIEDHFGIEITDEEMKGLATMADVEKLVELKVGAMTDGA